MKNSLYLLSSKKQKALAKILIKLECEIQDLNKLVYCKADRSYTDFIFSDNKVRKIPHSLSIVTKGLAEKNFIRTHKSYLANIDHIQKYVEKDRSVLLRNGHKIYVSKRRKKYFKNAIGLKQANI